MKDSKKEIMRDAKLGIKQTAAEAKAEKKLKGPHPGFMKVKKLAGPHPGYNVKKGKK